MKPVALKPMRYQQPHYPTLEQFDHSNIFSMVPKSWHNTKSANLLFSLLLISAVAGVSGCSRTETENGTVLSTSGVSPTQSPSATTHLSPSPTVQPTAAKTHYGYIGDIAPVFKGGEGFISYGDYEAPTYYSFTEEEGYAFIQSLLEKYHIELKASVKEIPQIKIPLDGSKAVDGYGGVSVPENSLVPFEFDWAVQGKSQQKVYVKLVTENEDGITGEDLNDGYANTDTRTGANLLQTELKEYAKKHDINAAVFYDPLMVDKAQTQECLKEQIMQFINWMKAEGLV